MVVVKVRHLNYDMSLKDSTKDYYFKSVDYVTPDNVVYCDTCHGLVVGKVIDVYESIDRLLLVDNLPNLADLKQCRINLSNNM